MELKVKYHYTYFIKPFIIKENKYEKYLYSLLNNKNCTLKTFEKERDFNIYSYFISDVRKYFFPTFDFDREKINKLSKLDSKMKAMILSKLHCNVFEYNLKSKVQGKIDINEGIFFNIDKIEIICFDTGICFLNIKTNIENSDKFSDLLNFNFRLKDINSGFSKLSNYTNIKVQTDKFSNMNEFSKFIDNIIGVNSNANDMDLYNKRFFIYTYSCIDQENWNTEDDFDKIENDFLKYTNIIRNGDTISFNPEEFNKNIETTKEFKYSRFGFTKHSASLIASSIDIANYTKLLYDYENEYLYTLIIALYQRIYLKKIEKEFKNTKDILKLRKKFTKFTNEIWVNEVSNSTIGTTIYNKWMKVFELSNLYNKIKDEYDSIYKEESIRKNNRVNKVILIALIISLLLNIFNFIRIISI